MKASELKPGTIVVLERPDSGAATFWVLGVTPEFVEFYAGAITAHFLARRIGPALEQITDDTGRMLRVFEYLGEP